MKICSRQGKFELMSVNHSARLEGLKGISFRLFFNMKVSCVLTLESPHRGDFNEYTQHFHNYNFHNKKKITIDCPTSAAMGFFPKDSRTSSIQPW